MTSLLSAITFDPNVRGILVVVVGVSVLMGSIYLIIATNSGARLGFLIAMAGLFGWMFLMSLIWWIYGIGLKGRDPAWQALEVNFDRASPAATQVVESLPSPDGGLPEPAELLRSEPGAEKTFVAQLPKERKDRGKEDPSLLEPESLTKVVTAVPDLRLKLNKQLGDWRILPDNDTRRGETVAAADAALGTDQAKSYTGFTGPSDYIVRDVFFSGGKGANEPVLPGDRTSLLKRGWTRVKSVFEPKNPELYSVVTLVKAKKQEVAAGQAPPAAAPEPGATHISVVMLRDLGNRRLLPFLFTLVSGLLFACFAALLHLRDKQGDALRAAHSSGKGK